jgi:hypothetical protein
MIATDNVLCIGSMDQSTTDSHLPTAAAREVVTAIDAIDDAKLGTQNSGPK